MASPKSPQHARWHSIAYVVVGAAFIVGVAILGWPNREPAPSLSKDTPPANGVPRASSSASAPVQPAATVQGSPAAALPTDIPAHATPGSAPSVPSPSTFTNSADPRPSDAPPTAYARVTLSSGRVVEQSSDVSGRFERVPVACGETVSATLRVPSAKPGDPVVFSVEDGGVLSGETMAGIQHLSADLAADFIFQVSVQTGVHRITAQHAGHFYVYDFWAESTQPASRF